MSKSLLSNDMSEPLGRQLVFTAKAMRASFEDALEAAGGTLATWVVLGALGEEGGAISQSVLASKVRLEGATITHHVDRLEALGLVAAATAFEARALAGLSADERATLRALLARIGANLRAPG